jgi:hypothetical protein
VIVRDAQGAIHGFHEKREDAPTIPGKPEKVYASMGNYIFSARAPVPNCWRALPNWVFLCLKATLSVTVTSYASGFRTSRAMCCTNAF